MVFIKEKDEKLSYLAYYDILTKLPNRHMFIEKINETILNASNSPFTVLLVDIDNFKQINDAYGNQSGDVMLVTYAEKLKLFCQDSIFLGRIGGDEFCAYAITDMENAEQLLRDRLKELTEELNRHSGKPYYISMSLGVKQFECSSLVDISHELEQADERLYVDKQKKRGSIYK